jgi:hypothetical protein
LAARVLGVSVWGPGLEGWAASRAVLAGQADYVATPAVPPPPPLLAATERRRTGPVVRLALAVAHEAASASGLPAGSLRAVFGSSNGDGPVVGAILDALATAAPAERVVSPTQFHNSVHNAPAGYWTIATGSQRPATCIGCNDDTFAASLLVALADLHASGGAVLVCCYDYPLPAPLDTVRCTGKLFAAALVLSHDGTGPSLSVTPHRCPADPVVLPLDPELQSLAQTNPAARSLPLLAALARQTRSRLDIPYLEGRLSIEVQP